MNLLKLLGQIEALSAAMERLGKKGRPSWIVPTAAIAVCGLTVWQMPNIAESFAFYAGFSDYTLKIDTYTPPPPGGGEAADTIYFWSDWSTATGT